MRNLLSRHDNHTRFGRIAKTSCVPPGWSEPRLWGAQGATPEQLAWAAGFIDGDGCLAAVVQKHPDRATPSVRIRVIVTQNDYRVLKVLQDYLGERGALNAVKRQVSHNRQAFQLQYDSGNAIAVIRKIRPYLVRKAAEADACMELFVVGKLNVLPGPRGFSPEVHEARRYWVNRIRKMK